MQTFFQDIRYGARMLLKKPGFALVAILTLGVGIGANTAIFSVVNALLLRPLAYRDSGEIVTLLQQGQGPVSPANFLDFQSESRSFTRMAAAEAWGGILANAERPEPLSGLRMGDGLFEMLGVGPILGRTLQPEDYRPGRGNVLVLSHKLWQRSFGGDPQIIGKQAVLSGESFTVVGVMPPQFQFPPFWSTRAEMWTALDLSPRATSRRGSSLRVFARLKPGVSLAQARAETDAINKRLALAYPEANARLDLRAEPLNEKVVGDIRTPLLILWSAVGFVLLIACANVACLLLIRSAERKKEAAIRVALGANRWRILRQSLTESLLLALCSAVVGILLAVWGVDWLTSLMAGDSSSFSVRLPRLNEIRIDGAALLFTLIASLATAAAFSLAPALAAMKPDLNDLLKESGRGAAGGHRRMRETLVIAELALAFVLLIGAGLLLNSFRKLYAVDPGFNPRNVLTMTVSLAGAPQYAGPAREALYSQMTERLKSLPGVETASAINHLPLAGDYWGTNLTIEGRPLPANGDEINAIFRVCRPDYFRAMGIPLQSGRDFNRLDAPEAEGAVVINETIARRYWPSEDPIGKRITLDDPRDTTSPPRWLSVVGVVKNVKIRSWTAEPANEIYLPFQQSRDFFGSSRGPFVQMTIVIRTSVDPQTLAAPAQEAIRSIDRALPVSNVTTLEQVIDDALWQARFNLQLIWLLAGVALILSAVGLYGVIAYSVAQRMQEVGLRLALGAQRSDIIKLVLVQGMRLTLIGVGLGLLAALALTRLMKDLLFQVSATDLTTFASIALLLTLIALLACWIPARRAAKVDPMIALRYE